MTEYDPDEEDEGLYKLTTSIIKDGKTKEEYTNESMSRDLAIDMIADILAINEDADSFVFTVTAIKV